MRRNTAILLFDDVEVLDFAGPFEVFAVTDELANHTLFNVYTIAEKPGQIRARNGLKIIPDHTLEAAPASDLFIIPGGFGTRALLKQPALIDWIRARAGVAEITASVCTGSLVLAKAGLLDAKEATTHYQRVDLLRELAPTARVHEDRRFLDNGNVLTSAGISAGIDMSLHLVARLHGREVAEATARYMEYPWRNDQGLKR